jgi:hypothetical protein
VTTFGCLNAIKAESNQHLLHRGNRRFGASGNATAVFPFNFICIPLLVGGQAAQVPLKELDGKPEPYDTPTLSDPSLERSRLLDFAEDVPTTKADDWGLYN